MRSKKKNMKRKMATESTEEHGNIKNFHVGCAVRTGDNWDSPQRRKEQQRNQLIQKTLQSHLKSSMPFSALSPIHTPRTHRISHFSLLTSHFSLFILLNFFRVFPCASVAITGFIFPCFQWIPWPLLVFYFLLFTFSIPLKAPASSPNNEYQYRPAGKHGP